MLVINVTGHRPNKLFGYISLDDSHYEQLKHMLKLALFKIIKAHPGEKEITVISGMALGVDQLFVKCMLDARAYYRSLGYNFSIVAAVPCQEQCRPWNAKDTAVWKDLLSKCDKVEILQKHYSPDCMEKRNKWMVERADTTIAVWDGSRGGTANCVDDALDAGNTVYVIDPTKEQMTVCSYYRVPQETAA